MIQIGPLYATLSQKRICIILVHPANLPIVWSKACGALERTELELPKGAPISISASVGIAIYPDDATDIEALIEISDQRLYQNKNGVLGKKLSSR